MQIEWYRLRYGEGTDTPDVPPGQPAGPAPDCDGLVRSLNARIDDRWKPVAKWCEGCDTMWRFDPDTGTREPPKPFIDTWYEVWVADYPGDNFTASCKVCGWRSSPHTTETAMEQEAARHTEETVVVDEETGETSGGHGDEDEGFDDIVYETTEATDEQWARRWEPKGPYAESEHIPRELFPAPKTPQALLPKPKDHAPPTTSWRSR